MSTARRFARELGLTHREFFRALPGAIAHRGYRREGDLVRVDLGRGALVITLGPVQTRRIAALHLPYTVVGFAFEGVDESDREAFMQRFDLYMRRGGG